MGKSVNSFSLTAADVTWARREKTCIDVTVAASALDGKYFTVDAPDAHGGANQEFYVWFDLDAGSVDPAPAGKTAIEVDVVTGETAEEVATKLAAALDAESDLQAKVDANDASTVIVNAFYGGSVDSPVTDVDTTFDIQQMASGIGGDLGKTTGGVSISITNDTIVINSDQSGSTPEDEIQSGKTIEVSMSLLQMSADRWKTIVGSVTGDVYTPAGGTEVVSYGTSRQYSSLFDLAGMLILHPTSLPASDRSQNITLLAAAPKPASYNYSGEEPSALEVAFTALPSRDANEKANLLIYGDQDQDFR